MKRNLSFVAVLIIATVIFSCKKNDVSINSSLLGKWSVEADSLAYGIGPVQQTKTYIGVVGDYFDFRSDNKLYVKEGSQLTTYNYKVISKTELQITIPNSNSIPQNLFIDNVDGSSANINIITSLPNPGGADQRWVSLVKPEVLFATKH